MKNITIFYHLYIPNPDTYFTWWVDEQMQLLYNSGLSEFATINTCITLPNVYSEQIDKDYVDLVVEYFKNNYPFVNIIDIRSTQQENLYEGSTLFHLYNHCKKNDGYVFYFQNKGSTSYETHLAGALKDWRHYMQYFNIVKWKECVAKLDEGYDCVGVDWFEKNEIKLDFVVQHYTGNFWWANNSYIRTLKNPLDYNSYINVEKMINEFKNIRYCFELWLGTNNPNYYCMHYRRHHQGDNEGLERYYTYYPQEMYIEN